MNRRVKVKIRRGYKRLIEAVLEETNSDLSVEDAMEYVYGQYEECKKVYSDDFKVMGFTKRSFIETFAKLYSLLQGDVFELPLYIFVECVSYHTKGFILTESKIEELQQSSVNQIFVD